MTIRIALYIGRYRFPVAPSDIGIECLDAMHSGRHPIGVVLTHRDDIVARRARHYGLEVLEQIGRAHV